MKAKKAVLRMSLLAVNRIRLTVFVKVSLKIISLLLLWLLKTNFIKETKMTKLIF